jgi:LysR family carnitine catabolism transcriptional activator
MPAVHPPSLSLTIRHLRSFLSVARHKNFTRAALELNTSQPSLTMTIRQLEDIVGASLFDRTTRSVTLTPEGADFVGVAERLVFDFDLAVENIQATALHRRGRISIAHVHSLAVAVIPNVLQTFTQSYPQVHAQLRDGNSSEVRRAVRRSEVDIGFCSKGEEDDAELDFQPLFRDQLGVVMRSDHPLAGSRRPLPWAKLADFDFIGLTADTGVASMLAQIPDFPLKMSTPKFEVSMNSTLWSLLDAGLGFTAVPAMAAFGKAAFGRPAANLVFRPGSDPVVWRSVFVVMRRGRAPTRMMRAFLALVHERIAAMAAVDHRIQISFPQPDDQAAAETPPARRA